jgi:hypothetical protein
MRCSNKKNKNMHQYNAKNQNTYQYIAKDKINNFALKIKLENKYNENELFFANHPPP